MTAGSAESKSWFWISRKICHFFHFVALANLDFANFYNCQKSIGKKLGQVVQGESIA